jgi:hypothetical protein
VSATVELLAVAAIVPVQHVVEAFGALAIVTWRAACRSARAPKVVPIRLRCISSEMLETEKMDPATDEGCAG